MGEESACNTKSLLPISDMPVVSQLITPKPRNTTQSFSNSKWDINNAASNKVDGKQSIKLEQGI